MNDSEDPDSTGEMAGLALAGRLAAQVKKPETVGSMPCDTPTFGVLVLGSVILVGALSFLPALALGPIAEHLHR
jgi:K+-transporting ATPase ATPase A chain